MSADVGGGAEGATGAATGEARMTLYWRPGCGFCMFLERGLQRAGVAYHRVNIWDEPEGAAWVRSVARGNETVPTVRIVRAAADGSGDVERALVNPDVDDVLAALS